MQAFEYCAVKMQRPTMTGKPCRNNNRASASADGMHAVQMQIEGGCTWAQASDRNLSCEVGVAVISLISSSRFSIIVFMASSADSRARSFSAHLQEIGERLRAAA